MISRLFSREPDTRVFFATDIHGSETCWKKFLNSGKHYEANALVLGGDMTGKALVPIVDRGGGRWRATLLDNRDERLARHVAAEDQDVRLVVLAGVQELLPADLRTVYVGCEEDPRLRFSGKELR